MALHQSGTTHFAYAKHMQLLHAQAGGSADCCICPSITSAGAIASPLITSSYVCSIASTNCCGAVQGSPLCGIGHKAACITAANNTHGIWSFNWLLPTMAEAFNSITGPVFTSQKAPAGYTASRTLPSCNQTCNTPLVPALFTEFAKQRRHLLQLHYPARY